MADVSCCHYTCLAQSRSGQLSRWRTPSNLSAPKHAAVYLKSGSLCGCKKGLGFRCGKYRDYFKNHRNSFAIVESPPGERRLHYMVMLISNVLRKNLAYDHQTLATQIHNITEEAHPSAPGVAGKPEAALPSPG